MSNNSACKLCYTKVFETIQCTHINMHAHTLMHHTHSLIFPPTSNRNCSVTSMSWSDPISSSESLLQLWSLRLVALMRLYSDRLGVLILLTASRLICERLRSLATTEPAVGFSWILTALQTQVNRGAFTRMMCGPFCVCVCVCVCVYVYVCGTSMI